MASFDISTLTRTERSAYSLRELYRRYGYSQYKMSKFEEYDLYVRNKSFLLSDHIITFTDHAGKLMALKPDVTLSIVKNTDAASGQVQKVYYNENVYRVPKGDQSYKEITQVGLECVGDVDLCCVGEVLSLAAMSLETISEEFVLDISHLGIVSAFLDALGLGADLRAKLVGCIGERNLHEIRAICREGGANAEREEQLCRLVSTYGQADRVLDTLDALVSASGCGSDALSELRAVVTSIGDIVPSSRIVIDFSVISNMSYYNGIVFRGFVRGIPTSVLSGGQYDLLLSRMGKSGGAVGFAVYLDSLEELEDDRPAYDVDTVLLYGEDTDPVQLSATVRGMTDDGTSVLTARTVPANITYRRVLCMGKEGVTEYEA